MCVENLKRIENNPSLNPWLCLFVQNYLFIEIILVICDFCLSIKVLSISNTQVLQKSFTLGQPANLVSYICDFVASGMFNLPLLGNGFIYLETLIGPFKEDELNNSMMHLISDRTYFKIYCVIFSKKFLTYFFKLR